MNPMSILKIKALFEKFKGNHPKIPMFFSAASKVMGEGSIIEINVTTADGKNLCTNMRVTADDLELLSQLKDIATKN
ncbi:MAG: hypothetical protein E7258_07135 [Lachnospiraceae bacterium]|nr:hypothetical protein [Lachnospiraceae bacterium]